MTEHANFFIWVESPSHQMGVKRENAPTLDLHCLDEILPGATLVPFLPSEARKAMWSKAGLLRDNGPLEIIYRNHPWDVRHAWAVAIAFARGIEPSIASRDVGTLHPHVAVYRRMRLDLNLN